MNDETCTINFKTLKNNAVTNIHVLIFVIFHSFTCVLLRVTNLTHLAILTHKNAQTIRINI